jgi:ketosteroid isomerase-like protein
MSEQDTRAAVDRFNDALNRHDIDGAMAEMTDDCVFESTAPPHGERFVGADAVRAAWERLVAESPTAHFDAEEIIVTGDRCIVRWLYSWTHGEPGSVRGVDVITVRDGKISEKLAYVKG